MYTYLTPEMVEEITTRRLAEEIDAKVDPKDRIEASLSYTPDISTVINEVACVHFNNTCSGWHISEFMEKDNQRFSAVLEKVKGKRRSQFVSEFLNVVVGILNEKEAIEVS